MNLKKPGFALLLILSLLFAGKGDAWSFGKNKVQYKQFRWSYIQSPHFDIYYYEGGKGLANFAASAAEEAYLRISDDLKYQPRKRIPLIVYNSVDDFQQTNVVPEILEEGVQGFTEQFKNRVVVHFTGSWREFRQLITHELTHAFTNDMLYGGAIGSLLTRGSFFQLPLWVAEGYAEFASKGWDTEADMVMRDAIINDYIVPLEEAGGYLVYKEGQSVMNYIAHTYGREKVGELITNCRLKRDMDKALKATLGIDLKKLNKRWVHQLKKDYWPEISCRKEGKDLARQLTDHTKDGSYLNLKPEKFWVVYFFILTSPGILVTTFVFGQLTTIVGLAFSFISLYYFSRFLNKPSKQALILASLIIYFTILRLIKGITKSDIKSINILKRNL